MDKFGIFNLLNSFFTPTAQSNATNNTNDSSANDFISGILNSFSNQENTKAQSVQKPKEQPVPLPLQSGMISVMNEHDAFIKRVKSRQNDRITNK